MVIRIRFVSIGMVLLAFAFFSCASTNRLHRNFTKNKASLKYIHDSKIGADTSSGYHVSIRKPEITDHRFTASGAVTNLKSSVIPLIVYTEWKADYEYRLGSIAVRGDIGSFIQSALIEESNRKGHYRADSVQSSNGLTLEIEVDSIGAKGVYHSNGYFVYLFFGYIMQQVEGGDPPVAYSRFHYRLKQGEKVLLDEFTSSHRLSEPLVLRHGSSKALRKYYNTNMVETLSFTIKENIEVIVDNIDLFLRITGKKLD